MTALLCPQSPRIASYLLLTHRMYNHQLRFVISEYLHMRRASVVARAGGDLEKAVAGVRDEHGRDRLRRHFREFVQRFVDLYSLSWEDAWQVALGFGRLYDYTIVSPEGSDIKVPSQVSGVVDQLTKAKPVVKHDLKEFQNIGKSWPEEDAEGLRKLLLELHSKGIVLFDRERCLCFATGVELDRVRMIFSAAAEHVRSQHKLVQMREKEIDDWALACREFKEKNAGFFKERYPVFEAYEIERTREARENLAQSQAGRSQTRDFHIRGHAVKGIRSLLNAWNEEGLWEGMPVPGMEAVERIEQRLGLVHSMQLSEPERFGDHRVFEWLAQHADDWDTFHADFELLLEYNNKYLDDRRPKAIGFSWPSWDRHPSYYEMEEGFTTNPVRSVKQYGADLANGAITLRLVVPVEDAEKSGRTQRWKAESAALPALSEAEMERILADPKQAACVEVTVPLLSDRRLLKQIHRNPAGPLEQRVRIASRTFEYLYCDKNTGVAYPLRLGGIKLVMRPRPVSQRSRAYIYFSTSILHEEMARVKRKELRHSLEAGTRVMAIDLGYRHAAFAAIREYSENGEASTHVWGGRIVAGGGRHLRHVDQHEYDHRKRRQQAQQDARGRQRSLPAGVTFDAGTRKHIDNLKRDLARQTSAAILKKALEYGVKVILVENLESYKPSTSLSRRENKRLATMQLRALYHELATHRTQGGNFPGIDRAGFYHIEVTQLLPHYTSRTCHQCGAPGVRYEQVSAKLFRTRDGQPLAERKLRGGTLKADNVGAVLISNGGPLFCCSNPDCPVIKINADYNAAQNLHRKFALKEGGQLLPDLPKPGTAASKLYWQRVRQAATDKLRKQGYKLAGVAAEGGEGVVE